MWPSFVPVTELCEYAGNVDVPIARESIRAVGKIALQQYDVNAIVDRLLQFLEMDKEYVTAETLVSFFDSILTVHHSLRMKYIQLWVSLFLSKNLNVGLGERSFEEISSMEP